MNDIVGGLLQQRDPRRSFWSFFINDSKSLNSNRNGDGIL